MHKSLWHSPGYTLLVVLFVIPLTGAGVDIYVPRSYALTGICNLGLRLFIVKAVASPVHIAPNY